MGAVLDEGRHQLTAALVPWRAATERALYGQGGFYLRERPGSHFRTSVHASPLFARAIAALLARVDAALDSPARLDLVDVGAGDGGLLTAVADAAPASLAGRLRLTAVERAPRPAALPAAVAWTDRVPPVRGLLVANEWLDNVPVDVVQRDHDGVDRLVLVDPASGAETLGPPPSPGDRRWLARWWPLTEPGGRAEVGRPRDDAWAAAVSHVEHGLAVAVDYGHVRGERPPLGTLAAYAGGRQVRPVPDGSCDVTAHVAVDAVAAAAEAAAGTAGTAGEGSTACEGATVARQRDVLRGLGVRGARPPRERASADPAGYLRALAAAGEAGELTDPAGLGGFWWVLQPVRLAPDTSTPISQWLLSAGPP